MENTFTTASLRSMAPQWSLFGDKQLLNVLEDIHQKIINRCQETNTKLEEMLNTLDDTNINLQNVNNKFMALSNSQFVESRVYDDDLNILEDDNLAKNQEPAKPTEPDSELTTLKKSLQILESMHESVQILNSESDSDTDDEDGRTVYKAKNFYMDRPLPHIIGSQAWKNKWHAGLLPEESDDDSLTSKVEDAALEEYSESESELETDTRTDRLLCPQRTVSSSSSQVESEPNAPAPPTTQAHIAAELARRLAGNLPEVSVRPEPEQEYIQPEPVTRKIYKPQQPTTSTIFFNEPPPLDQVCESDREEYDQDDIFAELHRGKFYDSSSKEQSRLNDDLFGGLNKSHDIIDELFGVEEEDINCNKKQNSDRILPREKEKKPVGGISLFGSNVGAEKIGTAILERNQNKSNNSDKNDKTEKLIKTRESISPSEEESNSSSKNILHDKLDQGTQDLYNNVHPKTNEISNQKSETILKEKDILQNIFNKNKENIKSSQNILTDKDLNPNNIKIDLFSDDLFDNIDDIFIDKPMKVPIMESNKNSKSIFDDDDDTIFADVATKSNNQPNKNITDYAVESLFDSDDDLFNKATETSENSHILSYNQDSVNKTKTVTVINNNKEDKSCFNNDNVDDDELSTIINCKEKLHKSVSDFEIVNDDTTSNLFTNTNKTDLIESESKLDNKCNVSISSVSTEQTKTGTETYINSTQEGKFKVQGSESSSKPKIESSFQKPSLFDNDENNEILSNGTKSNRVFDNTNFIQNQDFEKEDITENRNANSSFRTNISQNGKDAIRSTQINNVEENRPEYLDPTDAKDSKNERSFHHVESSQEYNPQMNTENQKFIIHNNNMRATSISPESNKNIYNDDADMFNEIFNDVPPVFEKPKEPKKSKNVNALFDDDSDDEFLFFKKNDITSDEISTVTSVNKENNLFRLFNDEPPAVDVDFIHNEKNIISVASNESNMSQNFKPTTKEYKEEAILSKVVQSEVITHEMESCHDHMNTEVIENKIPVGKLKSMNFNIDVATLLPGASPKKVKVIEEIDGQTLSKNEPISDSQPLEINIVKSVSFESEVDSKLLDNKVSKERAKIQIKRRPSTRKARREAVKKSGIYFGSIDSTDCSSHIEDSKIISEVASKEAVPKNVEKGTTEKNVKSKVVYILNDEDIFTNSTPIIGDQTSTATSLQTNTTYDDKDNDTIKCVDDDDIFKNIPVPQSTNLINSLQSKKNMHSERNEHNNQDLNKNRKVTQMQSEEININSIRKTQIRASIFDDISDEESELFGNKKVFASKSKTLFGSDDEDNLFLSKKSNNTETREDKIIQTKSKTEISKTLFGDESDDDDLFGTKKKSSDATQSFSKQKEVILKQTQSVLEDPLSLFEDED